MSWVRLEPTAAPRWTTPAVALGNFDGVHRGHQALVRVVATLARSHAGTPVALTFDPHPARVLAPERAPTPLMTLDDKCAALRAAGIEAVAVLPFTAEVARQGAEEFVRTLLGGTLGARWVAVGRDFRFGHGRAGDVDLLGRMGQELGFEVHVVEPVLHAGLPISSTRVREALAQGAVDEAALLLGRAYEVAGPVVAGDARGRTLGFPTANLGPIEVTLPTAGVYAAWCELPDASRIPAVLNVGRRPTFDGRDVRLEAHLLGWSGDLYGARVRLAFVRRLRAEQRFPGPDALRAQIAADVAAAGRALAEA
jgi:riboflavin kinase / FMN adenylyltransferase